MFHFYSTEEGRGVNCELWRIVELLFSRGDILKSSEQRKTIHVDHPSLGYFHLDSSERNKYVH